MAARFTLVAEHPTEVRQTAEYAARYILERMEPVLIEQLIKAYYPDGRAEEYEQIRRNCLALLNDGSAEEHIRPALSRRARTIARKAEISLRECNRLDVGGFLTFRLRAYQDELRDMIEYAVEEHISNEHYKEFIALLKYFVHCQTEKMPEVHLIHTGGHDWVIRDHGMRPIELTQSDEVVVETVDRELNYEDRLLSTLIAVSPRRVHIHTQNQEQLSVKTIQQIFEDRVVVCSGCKLCRSEFSKARNPLGNLTPR